MVYESTQVRAFIAIPVPPHAREVLEVWPESHWPGFALRQADVLQSYTA